MKKWNGIVIHCSDSSSGDNLAIDQWHKQRNWSGIGYHFVITNGYQHPNVQHMALTDGVIQSGRSLHKSGAHAKKYNRTHIGICLIGKASFSKPQMQALQQLIQTLRLRYNIPLKNIIGHNQCSTANGKTCPNFNVPAWLKKHIPA